MRVIKFRAWAKNANKMYQVATVYMDDQGVYEIGVKVHEAEGITYSVSCNIEDVELMQFTGLLDKNGKEIYEGDILDNSSGMNNQVVEWGRLGLGEYETDCYGFILPQGLDNEWYIKGNIYENPDLISHNL